MDSEESIAQEAAMDGRIVDEAPVGIVVTDPNRSDNPIVRVNDTFCRLTRYDREAVLGQNCRFLQGPRTRDEPVEAMRRAVENGEPVTVELRNYRADGTQFWNRVRIAPLRDEEGNVSHFVGYLECVDREKARERALERNQERFRALTENTTLGVVTIDGDSTVKYANDAIGRIFGHDPDDLVGESLLKLIPERFTENHRAAVERYLHDGTRTLDWEWVELPGLTASGEEVPLGISFGETEIRGERRFTAVIRDISARKALERQREEMLTLLKTLYNVSTDPDRPFADKVELLLEVVAGQFDLEFGFLTKIVRGEGEESGTQEIVHAVGEHELLQPGERCPLEQAYCRKTLDTDGLYAVADAVDAGWEDDPAYETFELGSYVGGTVVVDGDLYGTLCLASREARGEEFTDAERTIVRLLSRWVSHELERRQTQATLKRQNERLDQFASILAHDLRNPLNVAQGHLDLAREGSTDSLDDVEDALDRMEALIEDVLALARTGQSSLEPETVGLASVATTAWEVVDTGEASVRADVDRTVRADSGALQQLFENLFRNAVDHGPTDVTVTVGRCDGGFFVADDGPGIPPDEREAVLEFGHTSAEDNTGFGLAIVSEIAAGHEWAVNVTDSAAGGARFEFTDVAFVND